MYRSSADRKHRTQAVAFQTPHPAPAVERRIRRRARHVADHITHGAAVSLNVPLAGREVRVAEKEALPPESFML